MWNVTRFFYVLLAFISFFLFFPSSYSCVSPPSMRKTQCSFPPCHNQDNKLYQFICGDTFGIDLLSSLFTAFRSCLISSSSSKEQLA
jgi:ABC-type dipeptide/oligopeptide/nickel transport system permease subunit